MQQKSTISKPSVLRSWILASRPKTLTGAAAPVLVGGALAHHSAPSAATLIPFLLCLAFAFVMQIDANFINDYFDFRKGTDREDRLGPERACAQGWITPSAMMRGIIVTTITACVIGCAIMLFHQQWELLAVGAMCVLFCFLYTTCLSYLGLGDVLVLVFFGIVPVGFTNYVITMGEWDLSVTLAGIAMGLVTDNLLIVNNYRDRHQDVLSGKRTIIVRMMTSLGEKTGETMSVWLYLGLGLTGVLLAEATIWLTHHTLSLLILIYIIPHAITLKRMTELDGKSLNSILGNTARNIFLFGALLSIAIASGW